MLIYSGRHRDASSRSRSWWSSLSLGLCKGYMPDRLWRVDGPGVHLQREKTGQVSRHTSIFVWHEERCHASRHIFPWHGKKFQLRVSSSGDVDSSQVFMAPEYYLPLYFQSVMESSPIRSGYLLGPLIVATAVTGVLNGVFIHRTGQYRPSLWIGPVLLTLATGLYLMLDADSSIGMVIGFEIIGGIGSGLLFEPPLIAIQQGVHQDEVGTATSTQSFIRSMALSLSVIVGGIVFEQSMDIRRTNLIAAGLPPSVVEKLSGKNAGANVDVGRNLPPMQDRAVKDAFAWSIRNMFIMFTVLGAFNIVASLFINHTKLSTEHRETVTGLKSKDKAPSIS